jgi:hypothetical protein
MSELKPFNSERIYWAVEQVEREAGDIDDLHLDDNLFYLKSDADKVIAELKDIDSKNRSAYYKDLSMMAKDVEHQKFKRCLAMARQCHNESLWWYSQGYGFEKYDKFWEKWEKRWLELAEKLKEAK